jgi:hypothetical protein
MKRITSSFLFIAGAALMAVQFVQPVTAAPLMPTEVVSGKTQAEWAAEFGKWLLSTPVATNPSLDPTGALGYLGDVGPVFFVGTNFGGFTSREISVPTGKPLFLLVLGAGGFVEPGQTLGDLQQFVADSISNTTDLRATLDGNPIPNLFSYVQTSPVFSVTVPPDGVGPAGDYAEALIGGYFLMLEPLPLGQHTLTFGGDIGGSSPFTSDLSLVVNAVPEPNSMALTALATLVGCCACRGLRRRM